MQKEAFLSLQQCSASPTHFFVVGVLSDRHSCDRLVFFVSVPSCASFVTIICLLARARAGGNSFTSLHGEAGLRLRTRGKKITNKK